ncbi:MAG: hypothetical protein FJ357_04930 [Thaumarchaeota archaeon]|nr:hypothetical protein [Nitrososphaerota archaeon]
MITNTSKIVALSVMAILLFGTIYASVGLEEADAAKSKKDTKKKSEKAKKGMLAHTKYKTSR